MRISDWSSDACSSDLGTKRFITGNPLFDSLVALLQGGRPILGVIDMPILEERWVGAAGHPTTFTDRHGPRPARTRSCARLSTAPLLSTSPEMFTGSGEEAFPIQRRAAPLRPAERRVGQEED